YTTLFRSWCAASEVALRHRRSTLGRGENTMNTKDDKDKELEKELLALERQYWNALKDRDVETVVRLSDDTTVVTGAQGVGALEKEKLGGMIEKATYEIREFEIDERVQMRKLSENVAILAYKVHEELIVD